MTTTKKILIGIACFLLLIVAVQIINAAKYKMVVNVVEGENVMGVNPLTESLDFGDLSRNNGMTRYVDLKSAGGVSTYVAAVKFGEIADLIKLDKNFFVLGSGQQEKIAFEISVPPSAQIKKYSGWVVIFRLPKLI